MSVSNENINEYEWYLDSEKVHLFLHLNILASTKMTKVEFSGAQIKLKPGQLVTNRKELSIETGIDEYKIQRVLKFFENEKLIAQQKSNRNRLITVLSEFSVNQVAQQPAQQKTSGNPLENRCFAYLRDYYRTTKNIIYPDFEKHKRFVGYIINKLKNSAIERNKRMKIVMPITDDYLFNSLKLFFESMPDWWIENAACTLPTVNKHFTKILNQIKTEYGKKRQDDDTREAIAKIDFTKDPYD